MRILIDGLAATVGGGITYLKNAIPHLVSMNAEHEFLILLLSRQGIRLRAHPRLQILRLRLPLSSPWVRLAYEQAVLPRLLRRHAVDLLYSPADFTCLRAPCPVVLAIRNPNPYTEPYPFYSYDYWRLTFLRFLTRLSARRADRIIFVSEHSRRMVSDRFGLPQGKTRVVYHGLGEHFLKSSLKSDFPPRVPQPYILSVSTIYRYKNFVRLIEAFGLLRRRGVFNGDLVIAGRPLERDYVAEMYSQIAAWDLNEYVHLLNEVPYEDLPALYRGASLFVFPSYSETFGHPLVEAMACKVPVVASKVMCMPEICQDAALYFDPFDVNDMAQKMASVLQDEKLRQALRERGQQRAREFSWEKSARETLRVFEEVIYGHPLTAPYAPAVGEQ